MNKKMIRYGLTALLGLAVLPGLYSAAAGSLGLRLGLDTYGPDRVTYEVESDTVRENVYIISAEYDENGKMLEALIEPGVTLDGVHRGTQLFGQTGDSFGVSLIDGNTCAPISPVGKPRQCEIRDWNGALLSSQTVLPGHTPAMPVPPDRPGYIFSGWGSNDLRVWDDAQFKAEYIPAATPNVFQILPAAGKPGQEVTVTLKLTGKVDLCGFDMRLEYDGDDLEYVSKNDRCGLFIVANHVPNKHSILFNYIMPSKPNYANLKKESTIMTVTFRIREGADPSTMLKLVPVTVAHADENNIENTVPTDFAVTQGVILTK